MKKTTHLRLNKFYILLVLLLSISLQFCKSSKSTVSDSSKSEPLISFEQHISPIMALKCTPCHFPERGKKKLLHTYEATKENIDDILIRVQRPADDPKFMPFKSKKEPLTSTEIALFKKWLAQGMSK